MNQDIKPRRSVLYLPADKQRALEKAQTLDADCLIFDLEDAVSPANKASAREQLATLLDQYDYSYREKVIRINSLKSEWGRDDLLMAINSKADAILLPKVETLAELQTVNKLIEAEKSPQALWAMVETARGVENVSEFSAAENLEVLVMGTNDLSRELRVPQTLDRQGFLYSLSRSVLAARVNGLDIVDGVYIHFKDEEGLEQSCQQGKQLGFEGKTLIHPAQLDVCNKVFAPSSTDLEEAQAIVAAWQEAEQQGLGVVVLNGRLVEELHVQQAQRCLSLSQALQQRQ